MDVGVELRTAREQRGMSVADLAERTKISPRLLRSLETGDLAALPAPIFVRGFVRAYAREVGLDPDPLVARYMAQATPSAVPDRPKDTAEPREDAAAPPSNTRYLAEGYDATGVSAALGLAALALLIVAYLGLNGNSPAEPEAPPAARPASTAPSAGRDAPAAPVATTGAGSDALTLTIHPTGLCWVEVRVDGETRVYRLMEAGDRETVVATGEVVLRVGDPTQFAYSVNGRPGRPLGITSQPVTIRLDPSSAQQLVG